MQKYVLISFLFCTFLVNAASHISSYSGKRQHVIRSASNAQSGCLLEDELKKGKQNGDYAVLLQLIDFYFDRHRLDDVAQELTELIEIGEVRSETIVHLERLGDTLHTLCRFEEAFAWYTCAEYNARILALQYDSSFGLERISTKKKQCAKVIARLTFP